MSDEIPDQACLAGKQLRDDGRLNFKKSMH